MTDSHPTPTIVVLDPRTVERLATRTAELVDQRLRQTATNTKEPRQSPELLTVAEVAVCWGVHPNWVYRHARELGAIRLGDGRCARIRFDPAQVTHRLNRHPKQAPTRPRSNSVKPREQK